MPLLEQVQWGTERKETFVRWLHEELTNTMTDRLPVEANWKDWIEQWRAKLPTSEKNFPWPGASNLVFPLTAMHSDPVYADMMQTFHTSSFWFVNPIHRPQRVDHANSLREALQALDRDFLKMRRVNSRAFLDNIVLGTAIYKTHWLHLPRPTKEYDESGQIANRLNIRSQPLVEPVPLNFFYVPADAWEIDPDLQGGARWVAQKFYLNPNQLKAMASPAGRLIEPAYDARAVERVGMYETDIEDELLRKQRLEDEYEPWDEDKIELFEVHARYDVDGDGIDEDVVVIYHRQTDEILRALYNPFLHGKRPFQRIRYLQGFGFYGLGIAEIDEWSQVTMTKLLNGQIDNMMLANTRMYGAPAGSNILPGEEVYPGKVWLLGPGESIGEIRLGDIYPSLPLVMNQMQQWAESRTAVSELRQGNISNLPSRTPASTTLSILAEGNKKFDEIMGTMRDPLGEIGLQVLQLLSQYIVEDRERWESYFISTLGADDASRVLDVLDQNVDKIGASYGIIPTATSAAANKEVDKQAFVGVLQLVSQIYPQIVQTALLLDNPQITPVTRATAEAAYRGGVELLQRLLERFDIQNPEEYLPNLQAIQALAAQQQAQAGAAPGIAAPGGLPQPAFNPLGGFFGPAPFQAAQRPLGSLLGLGG